MKATKLPPNIREQLEKKRYFELNAEERVQSNSRCFEALLHSSKGDPDAERKALQDLRGGYR